MRQLWIRCGYLSAQKNNILACHFKNEPAISSSILLEQGNGPFSQRILFSRGGIFGILLSLDKGSWFPMACGTTRYIVRGIPYLTENKHLNVPKTVGVTGLCVLPHCIAWRLQEGKTMEFEANNRSLPYAAFFSGYLRFGRFVPFRLVAVDCIPNRSGVSESSRVCMRQCAVKGNSRIRDRQASGTPLCAR